MKFDDVKTKGQARAYIEAKLEEVKRLRKKVYQCFVEITKVEKRFKL